MCARLAELGREVERLEAAGLDALHVDVMDAHFVPSLGLSPDVVRAVRPLTRLPIHVHLMVERPDDQVATVAEAGADILFFHLEATRAPVRLARLIVEHGLVPGLALAPATPLPDSPELLALPHLLVMAVEPGFAGQEWLPSTVGRISQLRARAGPDARLHVDGHVDDTTVGGMWLAGGDAFVCGSTGLFTTPTADYAARATALRAAIAATADRPAVAPGQSASPAAR
jgi:ribulose-phosphate 3-epimerase